MSDIRLVGLDLDGTLLDSEKNVSERTRAALAAAAGQGVAVVPATGRPVAGVPPEVRSLPGVRYLLTSNGARVLDTATGESLVELLFTRTDALSVLAILSRYDCMLDVFLAGERYCTAAQAVRAREILPAVVAQRIRTGVHEVPDLRALVESSAALPEKFSLFFPDDATRAAAWAELAALSAGVCITSSLHRNLEVNAPGVDKGRALLALAARLGLTAAQVMACGDSSNDEAMLRAAGLAVVMGNAAPEVKYLADWVTASNDEDGVALAVERFCEPGRD